MPHSSATSKTSQLQPNAPFEGRPSPEALKEFQTNLITLSRNDPSGVINIVSPWLIQLLETALATHGIQRIEQIGLLKGLDPTNYADPKFIKRLGEAIDEKERLAEYCLKNLLQDELTSAVSDSDVRIPGRRLFLESGSTIAFMIGHFARELCRLRASDRKGRPAQCRILTNNLFALTALAGSVEHVAPIHGKLEPKYYGFMPFKEQSAEDLSGEPVEQFRFSQLREEIDSQDVVFGTCSNYSFLGGPLVGGRANALVKRALFDAWHKRKKGVTKSCYLMFHMEKIVPVHDQGLGISRPKGRCCCVFPPPLGLTYSSPGQTPLPEAPPDSETEVDPFHWHLSLTTPALRERIEFPYTKLYNSNIALSVEHDLPRLDIGWLYPKSKGIKLVISLPRRYPGSEGKNFSETSVLVRAFKWLDLEMRTANTILKKSDQPVGYKFLNRDECQQIGIAMMQIVPMTEITEENLA